MVLGAGVRVTRLGNARTRMAAAPGVGAAGGRARRRGPLRHSLCAYDREAGCGSKNRVAVARRRDSSGYHERRPPRAQTGTADRLPGHKPGAHRDIKSRWGAGPGGQVKLGPNRPGGGRPPRAWINCSEDSRERRDNPNRRQGTDSARAGSVEGKGAMERNRKGLNLGPGTRAPIELSDSESPNKWSQASDPKQRSYRQERCNDRSIKPG